MNNGHSGTSHIDLGDGDWAEIRTRITYGDRAAIRSKLVGMRVGPDGRIANSGELDLAAADLEGIRRLVTAWGGPTFCEHATHPHDGACVSRPITAETIADLPGDKGDAISLAIQNRETIGGSPGFTSPPSPPSSTAAAAESTTSASPTSSSAGHSAGAGTSS